MLPDDDRGESRPHPTLFFPRPRTTRAAAARGVGWSLAPELQQQVTRRLRLIAITYSLAFFFADIVPNILFRRFGEWLHDPVYWAPATVSILIGVLVAAVASSGRWSWQTKVYVGLVFEVVGSYGIAVTQYAVIPEIRDQPLVLHVLSPSWVAIWMLFYSIVVPAPPAKTLAALVASASAPVVVIWSTIHAAGLADLMPPSMFFIHHVLPYLICVGMAYGGTRVVYKLG